MQVAPVGHRSYEWRGRSIVARSPYRPSLPAHVSTRPPTCRARVPAARSSSVEDSGELETPAADNEVRLGAGSPLDWCDDCVGFGTAALGSTRTLTFVIKSSSGRQRTITGFSIHGEEADFRLAVGSCAIRTEIEGDESRTLPASRSARRPQGVRQAALVILHTRGGRSRVDLEGIGNSTELRARTLSASREGRRRAAYVRRQRRGQTYAFRFPVV